ncbi:MAG: M48 family metalloprotease [Armatimonadetes bacterium]|nr:M48 family metalloprotease [Armatimonadota bacterium]
MLCLRVSRIAVGLLVIALLSSRSLVFAAADNAEREVRLGREGAAEVEKEYKLLADLNLSERVNKIGQAIAEVANSYSVPASYGSSEVYQFDYKFKIIDDPTVNAFSLPGGFIYVHKGLLDYVQSDHELAGVLAHEVAHAAHHHITYLLKDQSRMDGRIGLVLLAGMLARMDSSDLGNILIGAQLIRIAKSSGYGQKAEADADATSVIYLEKAGFNPVGALTFLERLAHDQTTKSQITLGILQTHPAPRERCKSMINQIKALGLPINRRAVTSSLKASTEPTTLNGTSVTQVTLDNKVLCHLADIEGGPTSDERANAIAIRINQFLDSEPLLRDVSIGADERSVLGRGKPLMIVTDADSAVCGKPAIELCNHAVDVIKQVIWQDIINRLY